MKKIFALIVTTCLFISCSDEDFDINRDPDNLSASGVALSTEMPAGVAGVAGGQGAIFALVGGMWSQYWTQSFASNQYKDIDNYSISTTDYTAAWGAMYDALSDIRNVKRNAENQENWNYYLIATVMEVHASQILADFYDQIPYTEANNASILQPHFQSGTELYDLMVADLQTALGKDLSTSSGELPGADDFLFEGNMTKWTQFANTLLLKLYMRQTEARPDVAQTGITNLLTSGVTFLDEDAAMTQFVDQPNKSNPLYESDRRQLNTTLNLSASTTMFSWLVENGDPRRDEYYGPGISENQGDFGNLGDPNAVSVVTLSATTPVYFMSREESLFLQAEALERYMGGTGAKELYDAAVQENFSKWGLNGAPFVAPGGAYEYPSAGTFQEKLKAIIVQKWAALFPGNGFEAFFEQNRTGYPEMSPVYHTDAAYVPGEIVYSLAGTTGGEFPRRLEIPSTVTTRNANAPDLVEITIPVWWDVN
jgi:hypothetical protein